MMNLLAQYLGQQQPGLLGQMQQHGSVPINEPSPSPPPQIPQAQTPQIAPIQPLMPGQPSSMPMGQAPGMPSMPSMQPMGGGAGFGSTMFNGMFGPPGSSAAALGPNADFGSMIAKSLLKMFL